MIVITLTQNKIAFIDDEDCELVSRYKWFIKPTTNTFYAMAKINGRSVSLHQFLMGEKEGYYTDHIDRNGLNNQRANLRWATWSQNLMNQQIQKVSKSSCYKGVSKKNWSNEETIWAAYITINQKRHYLGNYKNEEDAALAYNRKAIELFGEFACLNPVVEDGRQLSSLREIKKTSQFLGVHWLKTHRLWAANIKRGGKQVFIGYFRNEEKAAQAIRERGGYYHSDSYP